MCAVGGRVGARGVEGAVTAEAEESTVSARAPDFSRPGRGRARDPPRSGTSTAATGPFFSKCTPLSAFQLAV